MTTQATPISIDAETEKIVRKIGIPPCPKIVLDFMQEMRKDDADMHRLSNLIGSDPGLAGAVLKTANSSMFGLKTKVGTVQNAFSVLGMRATAMLVSSLLLKRSFPVSSSKLIEEFWRNSASTAAYSAALAPTFIQIDRHVAYTYGLFRDCGQAVMLGKYPDYPSLFTGEGLGPDATIADEEDVCYPVNHAEIGAVLAQSWDLSDVIFQAILYHHHLVSIASGHVKPPQATVRLIALGALADQIQSLHLTGNPHREWETGKALVITELGLNEAGLENVAKMVNPIDAAFAA